MLIICKDKCIKQKKVFSDFSTLMYHQRMFSNTILHYLKHIPYWYNSCKPFFLCISPHLQLVFTSSLGLLFLMKTHSRTTFLFFIIPAEETDSPVTRCCYTPEGLPIGVRSELEAPLLSNCSVRLAVIWALFVIFLGALSGGCTLILKRVHKSPSSGVTHN